MVHVLDFLQRIFQTIAVRARELFHGIGSDNADDALDDLDDATSTLLSMIEDAVVVVAQTDEGVRANPAAYILGIVRDDAIVDERVLNEVHAIRARGGRKQFDLVTTSSPQRFMNIAAADTDRPRPDDEAREVTRTNWLKVTVGRINARFVVILIDDVSDVIRFTKVRDSFIANVSEQLLVPTQALEVLADSLEHDDLDPEQVKRNAAQVRVACSHLDRLVSDLLVLIKAQAPVTASAANQLSLMRQIDWVAQNARAQAEQAGVHLEVDGDESLMVNGEKDQIRVAITKLVDNAIAYSHKGSSVGISATRSSDGKHALVRVVDCGVGIQRSEQTRIFERFYRGSNQNERTVGGIGLGLAIVKHVALTHHGSAAVWSAPDQGSTFTLTLPIAN